LSGLSKLNAEEHAYMYAFKTFTITERDRKWKPDLPVENKTLIILLSQEKIKIFFYAQKN
jgi:hypothetical protein